VNNWILINEAPERWINLAAVRGLDVAKDGTGHLWWVGSNTPAMLSAPEASCLRAAIRGGRSAYRQG
jgi:hypothetical protein